MLTVVKGITFGERLEDGLMDQLRLIPIARVSKKIVYKTGYKTLIQVELQLQQNTTQQLCQFYYQNQLTLLFALTGPHFNT